MALFIQYISLYAGVVLDQQFLYYIGILPHGLIFGLFYVAGQIYTDKAVPHEFKAQAQGFLSFVIWGVGIFVGNLISGWMIDYFKCGGRTDWSLLFLIASLCSVAMIILLITLFKNPTEKVENK